MTTTMMTEVDNSFFLESLLRGIGEDIKSGIFDEHAEPKQLLLVALAFAVFWGITLKLLMDAMYWFIVKDEPAWILRAADRDYARQGKQLAETLGNDSSPEACRKQFLMMWPWMQAVCVQHFLGGLLCAPSLFYLTSDRALAHSLACMGILSEMGWEIQDLLMWLGTRYFTHKGKEKVAFPFLMLIMMHHAMTMCLAVPMILHYRDLRTLHWLCFDLQLGAAISLGVAEYTKLLDLSIPSHLSQFQTLTTFALITVIWGRLIHWVYLVGELMLVWYRDQAYIFLTVGGFLSMGFSVVSYAIIVEPYYKRWYKFCLKRNEYKQVAENKSSTQQQRRSSFLALDEAAEQMLLEMERDNTTAIANWIMKPRDDTVVLRRASLPASLKLGNNARRRSSFLRFLRDPDSDHEEEDNDSDKLPPAARRATTAFDMDDSMSSSLASLASDLQKKKDE